MTAHLRHFTSHPTHVASNTRGSVRTQAGPKAPERLRTVVEISGGRHKTLHLDADQATHTTQPAAAQAAVPAVETSLDVVEAVRNLFLPRGWPHSVTEDYLEYQLWTVPAHVTGWMSHSLATSSMLKAVGLGLGPAGTVGASAAIKWLTKDGLGAVGRLFVGGKLSSVFDEDPKRWRMNAEAVTTLGLALEIATQLYPGNFVMLAGAGVLAKSVGKGMGRPCFRVIQTYFSAQNNVGDVAAKEEVWEVTAQMLGLACSVGVLKALEASNQPEALIIPIWAVVHAVHVALRYSSLSTLRFPYPNQRRAAALVMAHVREGLVPGVKEVNKGENPLLPPSACTPHVLFGCSIEEALAAWGGSGGTGTAATASSSFSGNGATPERGGGVAMASHSSSSSPSDGSSSSSNGATAEQAKQQQLHHPLEQLAEVYAGEQYMLTWRHRTAHVLLWEGAGALDYMRAMYQAALLEVQAQEEGPSGAQQGAGASAAQLAASLAAMRAAWGAFEEQAAQQGWKLGKSVVPLKGTLLQRQA